MSSPESPIMQLVRTGVEEVLAALADRRAAAAREALERVRPVLEGRVIGAVLRQLLENGEPVEKVADGLYATGRDRDCETLRRAHALVTDALPGKQALLLVRFEAAQGGARHDGGLDTIGVISLPATAADLETLVHELVHGFASSGHRLLDEGLAEWLATLAGTADASEARTRLAARAADGPSAQVLAARRWTDQPCFEGLASPPGAAHAVAALTVAGLIERAGMASLLSLMEQVRAERTEDLRDLLELQPEPSSAVAPHADPAASARLRRQFRMGDVSGAAERLCEARQAHLARPDDEALEINYLLALLLAANDPDAEDLRTEFDRALERYVAARDDTPLAYALCVSREGLNIRYAPDFIALNDSFQRGRAIIEAALDTYPNDLDVVVTAAKFELFTPLEYGGSPALARSYLQRAATLTDDPLLLGHLRGAIARLAPEREAA